MDTNEAHINGAVSALVMLAAVAGTWSVYSYYQDDQVAIEYNEVQTSLEQTASAITALRIANTPIATTTATTTGKITKKALKAKLIQ